MKKRLNSTVARHGWTRPKINWSKQHPNLACLAFPKCSKSQIQKVRNLGRLNRIAEEFWSPGRLQNPKFRNWSLESEVQIWRDSLWMTAGFWGKFSLQPIPWRIVFGWQAYGAQWSFELSNSQIVVSYNMVGRIIISPNYTGTWSLPLRSKFPISCCNFPGEFPT